MRILIHDFAGHAFQVELSKALARRGHKVTHAYFAEDPGPKGVMTDFRSGTGSVKMLPISIGRTYSKSGFLKRFWADMSYRSTFIECLNDIECDLVISSNTPTWVQGAIIKQCVSSRRGFIFWCQDFYSVAVESVMVDKLGVIGRLVGWYLKGLDRRHMHQSDLVVHITERFKVLTDDWGLDSEKISVIPNWGAIAEIPLVPKDNAWAAEYVKGDRENRVTCALYSGTLGLKHDPSLLEQASRALPAVNFMVVGSGIGFDDLSSTSVNLNKLPLQPFERLPEVLATADILIAMIEPDAGEFSVPSKVLSYLCAGRPIVLSAPSSNLAASIVSEAGAGLVVEPGDTGGFIAALKSLSDDPELAIRMGERGREYAEANFDIEQIADKFERLFLSVVKD